MQKEPELLIILMIIITVLAIFFASKTFPQELDPVMELWGYEIVFYSVEYPDSVLQVLEGDTLQIRWDAPTTRIPYDEQLDYPLKGNWTGASLNILIPNDSVFYDGNSEYNCLVTLGPGKYELKITAIDLYDNYSKRSDGFLFEIVERPPEEIAPGQPTRIYIIFRGNN